MSIEVTLPYNNDGLWEALTWAKKYCNSYITNLADAKYPGDHSITFYFAAEKDATLFRLRWS